MLLIAYSMHFNAFSMLFHVLPESCGGRAAQRGTAERVTGVRSRPFSVTFNAFSMLFIAFSMLFHVLPERRADPHL